MTQPLNAFRMALVAALAAAPAYAGQTWNFDVNTSGQDVSWTSPTSVDPSASIFATSYTISLVEVDVTWNGIPFNNINVTSQLPPDLTSAAAEVPGPAPLALLNQQVTFPLPPDPPAFSGTLSFGLDGNGFGFASATNITLGTLVVNIPIFGNQTVNLVNIRIAGQLSIHSAWYDLGNALAGPMGTPVLTGSGTLIGGDPVTISLTGAPPLRSTLFVVGLSQLNAPFYGGVMVPALDIILFVPTDGLGNITIPAVWPAGLPANTSIYFQYWVLNGAGNAIDSASNALRAVAQ